MKSSFKSLLLFVLISFTYATEFSVQGVLRDPLGRTVNDGAYSVTFKIYDVASNGSALWTEVHGGDAPEVSVQHGVFTVLLGSITSMEALAFNKKYWIGITIEEGVEMFPRTQLTTSPYSKSVFGTDNVFPSIGRIGVGTLEPEAAFHIKNKNNETDILLIKDANNNAQVKVANDGTLTVPDGIFGNGELGVGTQDPSANIHIIGTSNDDPLLITDDAGATKVKLLSNGRLGIGTDAPEAGFHVVLPENDESDLLKLKGDDGSIVVDKLGKLVLQEGALIVFNDQTTLASANFGGAAIGVSSPEGALINAASGSIELNIGSGDNSINKVEISAGSTEIKTDLNITGESNLDVSGATTLAATTVGGTLGVTGSTTLAAMTVGETLGVTGATTLAATTVGGTLGVTGATTLVATTVGGTLGVTGATTLAATTIGGTLGVSGATTVGTLGVSGKVTLSANVDANSTAGTGVLSIGNVAAGHLSIDANEILARNASEASTLHLQIDGGDIKLFDEYDFSNTQLFRVSGNTKFFTNGTSQGTFDVYSSTNNNVMLQGGRNEYGYIGSSDKKWWEIHLYRAYSNSWNTYSDSRLKENIRFLNSEETLEKLLTLRGVEYDAKEGTPLFTTSENASPGDNENILGVIAQEVEKVFPGILGSESGGYKTVQYDKFVPVFIEAIKQIKTEKDKEIEELKKEYDTLLARIVNLENQ